MINIFEGKGEKNKIGQKKSNYDTALANLLGSFGIRITSQSFLGWLKWRASIPHFALSLDVGHPAMCVTLGKAAHRS